MNQEKQIYAAPVVVTDLNECLFYHEMDLPGYGHICQDTTQWDLRGREREYLGHVEFSGKRTLDVGTASGYLSFFVESQGADVISHDLSEQQQGQDIVPYQRLGSKNLEEVRSGYKSVARKLNNAYWLAHRALNSRARLVHSTVYSLPDDIGFVDIAIIGCVLLHVRDPFLALQSILRLTRETAIVTDLASTPEPKGPCMRFLQPTPGDVWTWWQLSPEVVQKFLTVLGFEETRVSYHSQRRSSRENHQEVRHFTVVGRRTCGL